MKQPSIRIDKPTSKRAASSRTNSEQSSIWNREIQIGPALPAAVKSEIYQQWGTLLQAGLSMLDSMEILVEGQQKKKAREVLESFRDALSEGGSLSESMGKKQQLFTSFEIATIKTGEQTGKLAEVLLRLGNLYEKRVALRKKVRQALSYPIVVIVLALVVLGFMMAVVVPMFEDVFKRFDRDLPPITQWVLDSSAFVQSSGAWIALVLGVLVVGIWQLRRLPEVNRALKSITERLPLIGKVLLKLDLARTTYSLGLLLRAKVNLDQALEISAEGADFPRLQQALLRMRQAIIDGKSLTEAANQETVLPLTLRQLIRVGEKTANLPTIIENYAAQAEEEAESRIQVMTQFLEPALIVILGGMVAIILVAMYLPMFSLSQAFG